MNTLQSSLLGILALLLSFTFSIALQRFDSRSEAVVDEANAIGTAYLRAQLLPTSVRDPALQALRAYLDLRVQTGAIDLANDKARNPLLREAEEKLDELWRYARAAAAADPNPVTSGLFVQAVNELIDSYGRRNASLNRHVPEMVLLLLFGVFVVVGAIIGYTAGIAGHRPSPVSHLLVVMVVMLVFIIVDLDRPRRGLIQVSEQSLVELQTEFARDKDPVRH